MAYKKRAPRKVYKKPMRYEVADMALKALQGVNTIRKLINVEMKFHDRVSAANVISTTGSVFHLSAIPQGDGVNSRDGDSIKPQYFTVRYNIFNHALHPDTTIIRLIFFRGVLENGVIPTVADLLDTTEVLSLRNYSEKNRFTVYADKTITIQPEYSGNVKTQQYAYSHTLDKHMKFVVGTDQSENGGLYCVAISNRGSYSPQLSFNSRITYTDN